MTDLLHDVDAPSDAELISRVRGGDVAAYGDLFARHVDAARRLARQLVRGPDADDLVSDAFAKVLSVLQGGGGPDVAFRAYLLTAVRRLHVDKIRSGARLQTSDDMEAFDAGVPFQDTAVAAFESGAAAKAFASLPERWQLVLWHLEVEGQKPADIAPLLGMSANSVSALAYRAREGLRQAFLTMHLNDISETDCRWVNEHLGAYVRNGLAKRDSAKVRTHLDGCRRCTAMYLELTEVNSNLAGIIAPLLLGAAATGYLSSAGGAAGGFGLTAAFGRVRDVVSANAGVATAGAVAAGVAAVATAGILLLPSSSGPDTVVGADRPVETVSTPAATAGDDLPTAKKNTKREAEKTTAPPALVPSVPASPAGSPVAVAVLDTGTTPGGAPSDGSTAGDSSGAPGGQTSTPSDPQTSPTEPAPTEPAPTEPAPTEPAPTEPAPTEPAPTEPAPTEPAPTQPPPAEPPPVTYTVTVGPATIADGQVSFDVTGDPELPPTVYLKIDSDPAGIVFSGDGTCQVRATDTTVAVCDTTPATAVASLARTVLATTSNPGFRVTMPLGGSPTTTTDVTITLSGPGENDLLQKVTTQYVVTPPTTADVSLTLPPSVLTEDVHDYVVPATVSEVPDGYEDGATFTLVVDPKGGTSDETGGPRAKFTSSDGCTASDNGLTLTCTSIPDNGVIPLHIYVMDNSQDTAVTISLTPLSSSDSPANNTASTVLKALRPADVKLALTSQVAGNAGRADATAVVTGAPAEGATLAVEFDPLGVTFTTFPDTCVLGGGTATCTGVADNSSLAFVVELKDRPANFSTETLTFSAMPPAGYADLDLTNNTAPPLVIPREKGNTTTSGTTSLLRATADSTAAPDLVDQSAGSALSSPTTRATKTAEPDLLSASTPSHPATTPLPSPTKSTGPSQQQDKKQTKKPAAKSDPGTGPGSSATPGANGNGANGNGANGGQGNGGQGNGSSAAPGSNGHDKGKAERADPVTNVITAVADLLP